MGVVYVYDGASLKGPTVEHPEAGSSLPLTISRPPLPASARRSRPPPASPLAGGFGGHRPCPDAPGSLGRIGDLDGGGKPDIVIGAPDYGEDAAADTNPSACPLTGPATCPGLGRVYVFSGEDVTAGSQAHPLGPPSPRSSTPMRRPPISSRTSVPWCRRSATSARVRRSSQVPVPTTSSCLTALGIGPRTHECRTVIPTSWCGARPSGRRRRDTGEDIRRRRSPRVSSSPRSARPDPQQGSGFGSPPVIRRHPATSAGARSPTSISRRPQASPPGPTTVAAMCWTVTPPRPACSVASTILGAFAGRRLRGLRRSRRPRRRRTCSASSRSAG